MWLQQWPARGNTAEEFRFLGGKHGVIRENRRPRSARNRRDHPIVQGQSTAGFEASTSQEREISQTLLRECQSQSCSIQSLQFSDYSIYIYNHTYDMCVYMYNSTLVCKMTLSLSLYSNSACTGCRHWGLWLVDGRLWPQWGVRRDARGPMRTLGSEAWRHEANRNQTETRRLNLGRIHILPNLYGSWWFVEFCRCG